MKALILAGGLPQGELIKQLKKRGISTVLADESEHAIARPYADVFYQMPIFDIEAVKNVAVKEHVDFLITVCADQVLLVVAQVSEMLRLPFYVDYKTAQDVSDKARMKRIFQENGIPTASYVANKDFESGVTTNFRFPLVIKPVDSYSSRGVRKVESEEELKRYYEEATRISRSGRVIIEEFYQGEEISVDAFVVNGKAKILCVSNSEKIKDQSRFVIFRGRYPVSATKAVLHEIEVIAQKIADAFSLINAPLLIQMVNNGERVSVLECCARTGGNMKYLLIRNTCGVDVISATIDLALGIVPDLTLKDTGNAIVVNSFIYCKPGVFDHLEGFEELRESDAINEYHAVKSKGTRVNGVTSSSDRIAGINIVASTIEEFNEKHRKIVSSVKVVDNEGNDIMRHDLLPDLE